MSSLAIRMAPDEEVGSTAHSAKDGSRQLPCLTTDAGALCFQVNTSMARSRDALTRLGNYIWSPLIIKTPL